MAGSQQVSVGTVSASMPLPKLHKSWPDWVQKPLNGFINSSLLNNDFNNCSVIGKCNYVDQTTQPHIAYTVNQCFHFSADTHKENREAIANLVRYLKTHHSVITFTLNYTKRIQMLCWCRSQWKLGQMMHIFDSITAKSMSGWIIFSDNCSTLWASKLET